jgi:DNA repair protein RecN (Recombination protein N)
MGTAIGAKLDAVAQTHQVLCITHLPQVAVYGKAHYVVRKEVSEGRTHTLIATVEGEARAEEVARMLGGKDLTSVTLRHAREMLKRR